MKKILKILIALIIIYLFISAIYVLIHIDFGTPPMIVGMGFSESENVIRVLMGIPKTFTTYKGVPPIYLLQVIIKISFVIILSTFLYRKWKVEK